MARGKVRFTYTHPGKRAHIKWSLDDQTALMDRGLFASDISAIVSVPNKIRARPYELVDMALHRVHLFESRPTAYRQADIDLRAHVALEAFHEDPLMQKLEQFIIQQDQHGWGGVWEHNCGKWHKIKYTINEQMKRRMLGMRKSVPTSTIKRKRRPNKLKQTQTNPNEPKQ